MFFLRPWPVFPACEYLYRLVHILVNKNRKIGEKQWKELPEAAARAM
jgi:hypothetical protein